MSDHARVLTDSALIKTFVLAGDAVFTVTSPSGKSFTFRVRKADPKPGTAPTWFVSVFQGSDNEHDYLYLGFIRGNKYVVGRNSQASETAQKAAAWTMPRLVTGQLPATVEFRTSGTCGRCGRSLTNPESIDRGIGPECWQILMAA